MLINQGSFETCGIFFWKNTTKWIFIVSDFYYYYIGNLIIKIIPLIRQTVFLQKEITTSSTHIIPLRILWISFLIFLQMWPRTDLQNHHIIVALKFFENLEKNNPTQHSAVEM